MIQWVDILHDGPVPAGFDADALRGVRADFIASMGWSTRDEVMSRFAKRDAQLDAAHGSDEIVLWFENDLYDQLQLIQILDRLADPPAARVTLVQTDRPLGHVKEPFGELFARRASVSTEELALARTAWQAFTSPDPHSIEVLTYVPAAAGKATPRQPPLPYLGPALHRLLEEYPGVQDGVSRSQRQVLSALEQGERHLGDVFGESASREPAIYLGDWSFVAYVRELVEAPTPLIEATGEGPLYGHHRLKLTDAGRDVIAGRADHVRLNGVDRWLGGVHLHGHEVNWRWDPIAGKLVS